MSDNSENNKFEMKALLKYHNEVKLSKEYAKKTQISKGSNFQHAVSPM